jgi:hypothetical protein
MLEKEIIELKYELDDLKGGDDSKNQGVEILNISGSESPNKYAPIALHIPGGDKSADVSSFYVEDVSGMDPNSMLTTQLEEMSKQQEAEYQQKLE